MWYKDDKVIRTDDVYEIQNVNNKTTCVIRKVTKDSEGTYMCKAVSEIGMAITKAKLQVFKPGEKIKKVKAKEIKEKVKTEKVIKRESDMIESEIAKEVITESIDTAAIVEVADIINETIPIKSMKKSKAQVTVTKADHVETMDVASFKKVDEKEKLMPQLEKIEPILKPYDYLISSQQQDEEIVEPFQGEVIEKHKAILKSVETDSRIVAAVNELLDVINAKEFGPGESPLRELAKIGYMLRNGVTTEEIQSLYDSEYFPALRIPQSQLALVQLVERQGHGALITEVLTEETAQDEDIVAAKAGFCAFLKMVELKHSSVEEVIAHFYPEDFKPRSWEQKEAREVTSLKLYFNITRNIIRLPSYRLCLEQYPRKEYICLF